MSSITISDLLGVKVRKVYSGSELVFLYELSKYTQNILGKTLFLGDITLVKELHISEYTSYLYHQGFKINYEPKIEELVNISDISRKFFNSDLTGIVFEKKTDIEWIYSYNTDRNANLVLNQYNRSAGYVSLYAYMIVSYYKLGKKVPKLILKNTSHKQEELEYVDILILKNFGNKWLDGKVDIEYSKEVVTQPEWEAYITYHRQLGYMTTEIKPFDKFKYINKKFKIGDVVLLYKTEKAIKSKTIRKLLSCHPAVIRSIGKNEIKLDYYPDITTTLTRCRQLEQAEEMCGGEYKYSPEDYRRFSACSVTLNYFTLGVDLLLYLEDEFILTPQNGVDTFEQYLLDKNGVESVYNLDTINTIYAVFEDRKIDYDKDRFLNTYFKKEKPIYDLVLGL